MKNTHNNYLPFISIVIPVYNEEKRIGKCIESLCKQTYRKKHYEILVIDNGSCDNTINTSRGIYAIQ